MVGVKKKISIIIMGLMFFVFSQTAMGAITNQENATVLLLHFDNDTLDYSGLRRDPPRSLVSTSLTAFNESWDCGTGVSAMIGYACNISGIGQYLDPAGDISFAGANKDQQTFTLWGWYYWDNNTNSTEIEYIFNRNKDYALYISDNKKDLVFVKRNDSTNTITSWINSSLFSRLIKSWVHIAVVYDGNVSTSRAPELYINGTRQTWTENSAGSLGDNDLQLFARPQDTRAGFSGLVDEVAIFNRSLNSDEIANNYLLALVNISSPPTDPTITLNSTNTNNGTYENFTCSFTPKDRDLNLSTADVRWHNSSTKKLEFLNEAVTENTLTSYMMTSQNITVDEEIWCEVRLKDSTSLYSNWVNSTHLITKDVTKPFIGLVNIQNDSTSTTSCVTPILLDISYSDNIAVDTIWYMVEGNGTIEVENTTITGDLTINSPSGCSIVHTITVFANDTSGNENSTFSNYELSFASSDPSGGGSSVGGGGGGGITKIEALLAQADITRIDTFIIFLFSNVKDFRYTISFNKEVNTCQGENFECEVMDNTILVTKKVEINETSFTLLEQGLAKVKFKDSEFLEIPIRLRGVNFGASLGSKFGFNLPLLIPITLILFISMIFAWKAYSEKSHKTFLENVRRLK